MSRGRSRIDHYAILRSGDSALVGSAEWGELIQGRELAAIDPATLHKRPVTVVNPTKPADPAVPMLEVRYAYLDHALVTKALARRSTLPMALMMPGYFKQTKRVLRGCTTNDKAERDFFNDLWYLFDLA